MTSRHQVILLFVRQLTKDVMARKKEREELIKGQLPSTAFFRSLVKDRMKLPALESRLLRFLLKYFYFVVFVKKLNRFVILIELK